MKLSPLLLLVFFVSACGDLNNVNPSKEIKSDSTTTESKVDTKWQYEQREDKMTSKAVYGALLEANQPLDLKFPYQGSEAAIRLVYRDEKTMAILEVTKGQFMVSSVTTQNINVRFDTAKAEKYVCTGSTDGDTRYLFIKSVKGFVDKLKSSRKVIIEAEMFDNGYQQMEFNCAGLKWDH